MRCTKHEHERRQTKKNTVSFSHTFLFPSSRMTDKKTVTIDDFEMLKVLGKGTFGKVCLTSFSVSL